MAIKPNERRSPVNGTGEMALAMDGAGFSQENQASSGSASGGRTSLVMVPIQRILDNPYQTRSTYDPAKTVGLAVDIRSLKEDLRATLGLQQVPLARIGRLDANSGEFVPAPKVLYSDARTVRQMLTERDVHVQLLFAHRRLRAFMVLAGGVTSVFPGYQPGPDDPVAPGIDGDYAQMPLLLAHASNEAMWEHVVRENAQREEISPIEEAKALQRAIEEFGYTYEQAAAPFGYKAKGTVGNKVRLLRLPAEVQTGLASGQIGERHARELLRLEADQNELLEAYKEQIKKGRSVAQLTQDVGWREQRVKEQVEKRRQMEVIRGVLAAKWTPPGSDRPLPVDRLYTGDSWKVEWFRLDVPKSKGLLDLALCGSHCSCCVVGWKEYPGSGVDYVRPDPTRAPAMCLGCKGDREFVMVKRRELETITGGGLELAAERKAAEERAEREAKAAAIVTQAETMWAAALAKLDLDALWSDMRFWRLAGDKLRYLSWSEDVRRMQSVAELRDYLLVQLLRITRHWDPAVSASVPDLKEVQRLISRLTAPVIPAAQPRPGDSQATAWRDGWDEDDQALYDDVRGEITGDECWGEIADILDEYAELTPRVLLRLIEECPSKEGRGELWPRYNALKGGDAGE